MELAAKRAQKLAEQIEVLKVKKSSWYATNTGHNQ